VPDPTRAEIQSQWRAAINILEETRNFGNVNAANLLGLLDTLRQSYEGDWIDEAETAAQAIRNSVAGVVSPATAARIQRPFLKQYMKSVVGRTDLNRDRDMLNELYKYFVDNTLRVQSRVFTFGTPAADGSNIGNGQILRLTKDAYNFDIETGHIDSKRAICIADQNTGTDLGREVWQVRGQVRGRDDLERSGSGQEVLLVGATADDSLLQNASWTGTAGAPTTLPGWTSNVQISLNYLLDNTNFFRKAPSDGSTSSALEIVGSSRTTQKLTVRGTELRRDRPYIFAVAWNRAVSSASGTLNLRMGSLTTSVALSAQTGWNITTVPNPIGQGCWYKNFAQDDLQVEIEFIRTGGGLLIDDAMLIPGTFFDGSWYWVIPASAASYIAPRTLDEFTWNDLATEAIIQQWLVRGFGFYLPHANGSSITWSEP